MNLWKKIAVSCAVLMMASAVKAEVTHPEYKRLGADPRLINYIDGIGKGVEWANAALKTDGKSLIYCPPDGKEFSADDYIKLIDKKAKAIATTLGDATLVMTPIEYLLVRGMVESYPCGGPRQRSK